MLLGESLAPLTSRIGFLEAPVNEVAKSLREWLENLRRQVRVTSFEGGLQENALRLQPLISGAAPRDLVVATRNPRWTAVLDCLYQGGNQVTTVGYLARTMRVQGLVVSSISDSRGAPGVPQRFGARQFELFAPIETDFLNYVRTISVIREGERWRFDAAGTVQDFEDEAAYARRKIADRFTEDMLADYCAALGLHPFDDDFYPGPSILLETDEPVPHGAYALSLAEARRKWGYDARG
ncbi:hypothetical protein ACQPZX_15920 [Actinoplanes sp. CA-142083]|uniref:hypothetical protein n=1 Tax=Actinoplanes sp. CA-142083 TaxID=3239903 RepID=UPI003D89B7AE